MAAINAQITIEFKIFNKFSREEFSRTPYKARLCISERRHHDKNRIEGQDKIEGKESRTDPDPERGL